MNLEETRQQILESDEFVLREIEKIQYLYGLKKEIRFNDSRTCVGMGESVAEHVYGMMISAQYFLPLEDIDQCWEHTRIHNMMLWHDMDEIETGDIMGYLKTDADRVREREAEQVILKKIPASLEAKAAQILNEYNERTTPESKFVKAIDKIESLFQAFNPEGKAVFLHNKCTLAQHNSIKVQFIKDWPYMNRFKEVITTAMVQEGYFQPET